MGVRDDYKRYSRRVTKTRRWKALRLEILRRDGFACVAFAKRGRLEIDHIIPVRDAPTLSYEPTNLQTLCTSCHSRKTRLEIRLTPVNPKRERWCDAIRELEKTHPRKDTLR